MDETDSYVSDGAMAKTSLSIKVGAAIRKARKQRGLVMRHIAEHNETDVAAVGNWETGRNLPKTENLLKTAAFLRVDPVALGRGEVVFLDDADNVADAEIVTDAAPLPAGPMDIELLGAAVGGDDGDFTFNGEVAGYVQRPPGIAHLRKVFALHVLSDSMVPRYEPGEMLYCGGRDAVPGDHVVIEMFPEENERNGKAFIKKLVKRTAAELVVEQYNPPKTLIFNRYAIKHVWRVIPLKELLGY
ncbi:phage repressor protein C [Mesorhizobium temperatum]|uniref:Phage repressor protein C n=2 Tax=Mesorhizobium temperatum TaxID=241416 RepID=A0A271LP44_9HYPH|nr:phage repressor protein C [Mesorhizobium temperatum]